MGKVLKIFILVLTLSGTRTLNAQISYPLNNDPFSLDYEIIYRDGVASQNIDYFPTTGPYFTDRIITRQRPAITAAASMFHIEGSENYKDKLQLYSLASGRYLAARGSKGDNLPSLISGFAVKPGEYFGAAVFFNLDRARAIDPDYTGKKYRGLAGEIETAAISFRKSNFSASMGRTRIFWGQQRANLNLSETIAPLDLITANYRLGRLTFSFLFARLDGSRPDSTDLVRFPDRDFQDNRYLASHRLDIKLHQRFRLGLYETVLFGGPGRSPELYYLNPLQFFHGAQLNENSDDNTMVGLDFTLLPGYRAALYGQLLIDDIQIDNNQPGDREPDEYGFLIGLFKSGKTRTFIPDIKAEYVRITNRTYHQADPANRYIYRNKVIGHPLGPDADSLSFKLRFWPNRLFYCELETAYRRHGEGSLGNSWDEPWLMAEDDYSEPFPTGTVEKATLIAVRARGYLPFSAYTRNHFFLSLDTGWGDVENVQNIAGQNKTAARLDISLTWLGYIDINLTD